MRLSRVACASVFAALLFSSCVVDESFSDGQFLCDPQGGADECPEGMKCSLDGRCRHSPAKTDGGTGGKDGGNDGNCFPTQPTCSGTLELCRVP